MREIFSQLKKFSLEVFRQFRDDGCFNRAAGLAYTTLLSLVPLLAVSFSVLTAFPVFQGLAKQVQDLIFDNFVATAAQTVQQQLLAFIEQTRHLSAWGMLCLLVAAVLLVFSIEQTFNYIWRVKRRREDVSAFLLYWAVITLLPILIGVGIASTSYILSSPLVSLVNPTLLFGFKTGYFLFAPYFITYVAFALLYIAVPNCKVPIKSAAIAAFPATILFEISKFGFTFYIVNFPTYKLIYGALAALPIFLVWLYVSWIIILFGAVVSYVLTQERKVKSEKS